MDKQPQSRAPLIIAVVLLILPVLYVGSYFALVVPRGITIQFDAPIGALNLRIVHYRLAGTTASGIFWPLEQIDRKLRPRSWYGLDFDIETVDPH
jgi:hypothetical protein